MSWRPDGRALAVACTIERSTREDEEKYEGHFFKLLTEEGPIDMKEEISLPSAAISMVWQGLLLHNVYFIRKTLSVHICFQFI